MRVYMFHVCMCMCMLVSVHVFVLLGALLVNSISPIYMILCVCVYYV